MSYQSIALIEVGQREDGSCVIQIEHRNSREIWHFENRAAAMLQLDQAAEKIREPELRNLRNRR